MMNFSTTSLRSKIFMSMILLTLLASLMILAVTVSQYKEEAEDYHKKRLVRKETAVKKHIQSVLDNTTYQVIPQKLPYIFKNEISILSKIHNMPINIYDFNGHLLITSRWRFRHQKKSNDTTSIAYVIKKIDVSPDKRYVEKHEDANQEFQSSYTYIYDKKFKPIAILNLPYLADSTFYKRELREFLGNLTTIYLLLFMLATLLSYFLSRYITKSLNTINQILMHTSFSKENQKIEVKNPNDEINQLIDSYNKMVDELEESAKKLAQTEREQAWRDMARQVAHEIKNPLTPMRLNIQSFQMTFNPDAPDIKEKFKDFSNMLIEQIDIMSNIATAFSDFAKMPKAQLLEGDLVETIKKTIALYDQNQVKLLCNREHIIYHFDRSQIQRVLTNLIKNGLQSVPNSRTPEILVSLLVEENQILIKVKDNGNGIPIAHQSQIFEPKFTTKSSGMGLGLSIVKRIVENHFGSIHFKSIEGKGTEFVIILKGENK